MKLKVKEIIKTDMAVSVEDGDLLFEKIVEYVKNDINIELDFSELDLITTAFLNNAFGKLYSIFSPDTLNKHIKIINIRKGDLSNLGDVKKRATLDGAVNFKKALLEELGEDE